MVIIAVNHYQIHIVSNQSFRGQKPANPHSDYNNPLFFGIFNTLDRRYAALQKYLIPCRYCI